MAAVAILPMTSAWKNYDSKAAYRVTPRYSNKRDIKHKSQPNKDRHQESDLNPFQVVNRVAHKPTQAPDVNNATLDTQKLDINTLRPSSENDLELDICISPATTNNGNQPSNDEDQILNAQDTYCMADTHWGDEKTDWYTEYQRCEAMNDLSIFPEPDPEDISQYWNLVIPEYSISPVLIPAPFGSGRKGKDKSQEEYAAAASIFGWGGSYNKYAFGRNARGDQSDEGEDPNKHNNNNSNSGGGSGGGRGGDEGGDGEKADDANQRQNNGTIEDSSTTTSTTAKPTTLSYGTTRDAARCSTKCSWVCCTCSHTGQTGHILFCPDCSHLRCDHCEIYRLRSRGLSEGKEV